MSFDHLSLADDLLQAALSSWSAVVQERRLALPHGGSQHVRQTNTYTVHGLESYERSR